MHNEIIEKLLADASKDTAVARADITRSLVKQVYDFVKFNRPEGQGLDGMTGPERESLGQVLDAAENHYFAMLEQSQK
ncbi:hypothetical protein [Ewingella americana]|uniref:hypothetical protein n=1 Tax=Ewingella americana TaxID=41202 RepID=UPI00163B2DD2|nr:hypothetical protein [Ewingella americana]QMV54063.1 hypothetical protein GXP68_22620 [Ewingella americana]